MTMEKVAWTLSAISVMIGGIKILLSFMKFSIISDYEKEIERIPLCAGYLSMVILALVKSLSNDMPEFEKIGQVTAITANLFVIIIFIGLYMSERSLRSRIKEEDEERHTISLKK